MLSLNDTICNIIKTDNLNIALSEDNGNEIANILTRNKINYNLIDIKDPKSDSNSLILSLEDDRLKKSYDHLGKLILKFQKNFIIIRKLHKEEYITTTHNMIMSLGFNAIIKLKEDDLFYIIYAYNISNYKMTPDWLNSKNWANPELWEK